MSTIKETGKEALEALITDNSGITKLEDYLADFNIFEVLGVQRNETRHSAFIAWLLNPGGTHGLGNYFLRRFLWKVTTRARSLGISDVTAFDVDRWALNDVLVETERHNIDIVITSPRDKFVCAVENKAYSGEHSNQLERYRRIVDREYANLEPVFVLLTIEGDNPQGDEDAAHYIPLSYLDINELLNQTIKSRSSSLGPNVVAFMHQYITSLRRHVLAESDIQELARRIYSDHREAIDLIIEAIPDSRQEVRDIIESVMEDRPQLKSDFSSKTLVRYYPPEWDDVPEFMQGDGWTESGRMLLFEFRNNTTLSLHLVLGPGPAQTRQSLFDAARRNKELFNTTPKNLTPVFASIYRKRILTANEHGDSDRDATRRKIEEAVDDFLELDLNVIIRSAQDALKS